MPRGSKQVLVDADSFWVDGYFEETNLAPIRVGDRAQIKLMGHSQIARGRVDSIASAINVANAQPNNQGEGWLLSTRSSLGCAWRSVFPCASISRGAAGRRSLGRDDGHH